ncbi:MAG: 5-oxoprolinase subunit PxpB [Cyclobacteriaceae bacterium]
MSIKEFPSVQFNNLSWKYFHLGERTLLLQAPGKIAIEEIHQSASLSKQVLGNALIDIVPSYDAIALFYQGDYKDILKKLESAEDLLESKKAEPKVLEIPVCYEMGMDLEEVASYTKMRIEELVEHHENGNYRVMMIGFTPGFIYMDGLATELECPRKSNPRKHVEAGSVGIGGSQTGIYSLNSPGGWNIIGRTPLTLFDSGSSKPPGIEPGTKIRFSRITKEEFERWEN